MSEIQRHHFKLNKEPRAITERQLFSFLLILFVFLYPFGLTFAETTTDCTVVTEIPQVECEALVALYNSTNGKNWSDSATNNWNVTNTPCSWEGVSCNAGQVTVINRGGKELTGTIPPELGNLSHLTHLGLYSNQLTGIIPSELGKLNQLKFLKLCCNQLTGTIPSELGYLSSNLRSINLSSNQLTGSIPSELGDLSNLTDLTLGPNQLTGNIPPALGNLSNLTYKLWLAGNQLTGTIPPALGNLSKLIVLGLHGNQLTGTIPSELGNLNNLKELWLSENQLTGTIPPGLRSLNNLTKLILYTNQLTGTIPAELMSLSNLSEIELSCNKLTIPSDQSLIDFIDARFSGLYQNDDWKNTQDGSCSSLTPVSPTVTDCTVVTEIPQVECEALVALYKSTDGPNWKDSPENNWNVTNTPCSWKNITCNNGHVTAIVLDYNDPVEFSHDNYTVDEVGNIVTTLDEVGNAVTVLDECGNIVTTFDELGNAVTITVARAEGSDGMITVNYATQENTAKAGKDYKTTQGTLTWADGDNSAKTFQVLIANDNKIEGNEIFTVILKSTDNTVLDTTTVNIVDRVVRRCYPPLPVVSPPILPPIDINLTGVPTDIGLIGTPTDVGLIGTPTDIDIDSQCSTHYLTPCSATDCTIVDVVVNGDCFTVTLPLLTEVAVLDPATGEIEMISGVKFSGGLSVEGRKFVGTDVVSVSDNNEVLWVANIAFDPADVGEEVDIVVVATYAWGEVDPVGNRHISTFYLTGGGEGETVNVVVMSEPVDISMVESFIADHTIEAGNLAFALYKGVFGKANFSAGELNVYVGYRKKADSSGKIVFNQLPITLKLVP